ncbi:MAG: phage holin family protein [Bacteroidia bacterium]|nr:phage holin family protein [Bacteroidia bacterium]
MEFFRKIILTAAAVFLLAYLLPGISVSSFGYALLVALVLGFLRAVVKPILVIFTLPVTVLTFGLFLLVINACMVLLADKLLDQFSVSTFGYAILFSVLLSLIQSFLFSTFKDNRESQP